MPDIWKLVHHCHLGDGTDVQNVFWYEQTAGSQGVGADLLRSAFLEDVIPQWKLCVSTGVIFDGINVDREDGAAAYPERYQYQGDAGSIASHAMPANTVLRINKRASSLGGTKRGGMYLSGVPESQTDGNRVIDAYQTGVLNDFLAKLISQLQYQSQPELFFPVVRWSDWAKLSNATASIAPGAQSVITITDPVVDLSALGFTTPGRVSISGPRRITGTYDIVSVGTTTITVDYDLPNIGTTDISLRQRLSVNYDPLVSISANPVLKTLKRRTSKYESMSA